MCRQQTQCCKCNSSWSKPRKNMFVSKFARKTKWLVGRKIFVNKFFVGFSFDKGTFWHFYYENNNFINTLFVLVTDWSRIWESATGSVGILEIDTFLGLNHLEGFIFSAKFMWYYKDITLPLRHLKWLPHCLFNSWFGITVNNKKAS